MLMVCVLGVTTAFADSYQEQHAVGWHWYDDPQEAKKEEVKAPVVTQSKDDAIEKVNTIRKNIKRALDTAILDPTPQNIQQYITMQNEMSERASQFANMWEKVLLSHPELNYSITHPTNQVGIQAYQNEESKKKDAAIAQFKKQYGLFFFYKSTCPYCKRFAPILANFVARHGLTLVPITMDGKFLPEFPNTRNNTGQAEKFHVSMTPALFAVNPYNQKAFPVAYGLTSETELRDNIYKIMTQYQGARK